MARYQFILDRLNEIGYPNDCFVVDCACGLGQGMLIFHNEGFTIKGFDISPKTITKYVQPLGLDAECADIVDLPLSDSSVDIFICSETLEHLDKNEIVEAAEEIKRVSKDNSIICITVPAHKKSLKNPSHKQYITINTIRELFVGYGVLYHGKCNTHPKKKKGNLVVILRVNKNAS